MTHDDAMRDSASLGEYAFIRYLHVRSSLQNILDVLAAVFLAAALLSFASPSLWCALLGGVFALAVVKYLLVARETGNAECRRYAREKVVWESPVVVGLVVVAIVFDQLPPHSKSARLLQLGILVSTTVFAIWMIGIRHAYRRVAGSRRGLIQRPGMCEVSGPCKLRLSR